MAVITKTRGQNSSPVTMPVYDAPLDASFSAIMTYPIVNQGKATPIAGADSILSKLDLPDVNRDVCGWDVVMVCQVGDIVTRDKVKLVGEKSSKLVVEIGGEQYSIQRSCVRLIVDREVD